MANWNLSVDLRGQGNSLATALRQNAGYARDLASAAKDAKSEVAALGAASRTAAGNVKALGREAGKADRDITSLGTAADNASRNVTQLGNASLGATNKLRRMANQARDAAKDLRDLAAAAAAAEARLQAGLTDIRLIVDLDDQTGSAAAAVHAAMADLQSLSPAHLTARLDDDTGPGVAAVRAALAGLHAASPVRLAATFDADLTRIAATTTAMRSLATTGDVRLTADLDDRTATGIADVHRAVTALHALSPVRIDAELDDQTGPGVAAVRASMASLRASSPVVLDINVSGDLTQIAAAALAMRDLQNDARHAGTAMSGMTPNIVAAAAALVNVKDAAQDASRVLRILRARARAAADAFDELRNRAILAGGGLTLLSGAAASANGHMGSLGSSTRSLRSDLDDLDGSLALLVARLGTLGGSLGTLGSAAGGSTGKMRALTTAALALGPALIPIVASLAPLAVGLAAAGVGVGAFGLAIVGQIKTLSDAAEAQKGYDDALREHGKASPEAIKAQQEMVRQFEEMPQATRDAAAGLGVLKDNYSAWSDSLAGSTMPVATKAFATFGALFPHLTPLVEGSSKELNRFMTIVAGGVQSPGFDRFMTSFAEFSEKSLRKGNDALVNFANTLDTGEIGGNFREFMDYARANGPLVADTVKQLTGALSNLLVGASGVGVSMLTVVNVFAKLANAVPTEVISALLQLAIAIKLVKLAVVGGTAIGAAMTGLAASIAAMRVAAAGAAGPVAGFAAALATLSRAAKITLAATAIGLVVVAAVALSNIGKKAPVDVDKLTTSLGTLGRSGELSGEGLRVLGKDMSKLKDAAQTLAEPSTTQKIEAFFDVFGSGGGPDAKEAAKVIKGVDESLASMVQGGKADLAAASIARLTEGMDSTQLKEFNDGIDGYRQSLANQSLEAQLAADAMGLFGEQALASKTKLDAQKASADGLRQSIVALNEVNRAGLGGMIGFEASLDAAAKAAKENAGSLRMVNGELDANSPKAQAGATALQDLAAKTDDAATSARESGKSWEHVNGIYARGEAGIIKYGQQLGLTKAQATLLAEELLTIPDKVEMEVEMRTEDAISGLDAVIAKIKATPGSKSVTVKALTKDAIQMLEALGFKVKRMPNGQFKVTAATGAASSALAALQRQRDGLKDKSITLTTTRHYINITEDRVINTGKGGRGPNAQANGSVLDFYGQGGIQQQGVRYFADGAENHVAQVAPAGQWRVWAEPETGGEAYIPLAASKRGRSRKIAEETVRRLGGDPKDIQWKANGGVTDWRYDPQTGSLYSPTDAGSAGQKTKKVKGKDVSYFDLGAVEKKLKSTAKATTAWNKDLQKIADLAGGDVAQALASMGKDGVALTHKMATGSTKYLNEMAAALRNLGATAKASLSDYTRQLTKATATDSKFAANLAALAGHGYGDLAAQLAAQGDTAAMELAAAAVGDRKKAGAANTAAGKANQALTSEQVQQLVAIISAVRTNTTGLHDVADTTGLGEDAIVATASKATAQIKSALGSRATKFLADLARAQKGMSYADGGIRAGMYATQGGIVRFAEPETHGEAYIPLGMNKRPAATKVLRDVAARFGVGLTDVAAARPYVIVRDGGDTNVTVTAVRTGATASDIGSQVGRSVRRARRGGVAARAGS